MSPVSMPNRLSHFTHIFCVIHLTWEFAGEKSKEETRLLNVNLGLTSWCSGASGPASAPSPLLGEVPVLSPHVCMFEGLIRCSQVFVVLSCRVQSAYPVSGGAVGSDGMG